jgi:mono/diheme cytochrome c family protein
VTRKTVDPRQRIPALVAAAIAVSTCVARAADAPSFDRDVRPILKAACTQCHGEEDPVEGGVDLRLRRFLDRDAEGYGALLVPGDPGAGELLRVIRSGEMPKAGKKVSADELATIERWVAAGARSVEPEPESIPLGPYLAAGDRAWWSFQPIVKPAVPAMADAAAGRTTG